MDVREQIAEIIYSHEACYTGKDPGCDCGRWRGVVAGTESHADHLADEIVKALGLREEQYRSAVCPDDQDYDMVRLTTGWRPAKEDT